MNTNNKSRFVLLVLFIWPMLLLNSCSSPVQLTASWSDNHLPPAHLSKILVMAIGKDLQKRKLGEDKIKAALVKHGFTAMTSLDEFRPDFAKLNDSIKMRQMLLEKQFDGVLTVRVLNIDEHDRWIPGSLYYGPIGFYYGFYGYYYRVWGYYNEPGYMTTDVKVLLESNLYKIDKGELLWSGQSTSFSRHPTSEMARLYAKNIVDDIIAKRVIQP